MSRRKYEAEQNLSVNTKPDYDKAISDFNRDKKYQDFTIPKEWDESFREIIHEKEPKKKYIPCRKRLAIAMCAVLLAGVFGMMWTQPVEGNSLREFFSAFFREDDYGHSIYGTDTEIGVERLDKEDNTEFVFESKRLEELLMEIREVRKSPMFYYDDLLGNYIIIEAIYKKEFEVLTIELETEEGNIYITQYSLLNNTGLGTSYEQEVLSTVYNKNLMTDIYIYESITGLHRDGFAFGVKSQDCFLWFDGVVSLEVCEKFAESLYYK